MAAKAKKALKAKGTTRAEAKPPVRSGSKRKPVDTGSAVSAYLQKRMLADPGVFTRSAGAVAAQHAQTTRMLYMMRPNVDDGGNDDGGGGTPTGGGNSSTGGGSYTPPAATAFWWGFNVYVPEDTMVYLRAADTLIDALNEVFGAVIEIPWVGWFIAALIAYIDIEWALIQAVDKGNGAYVSMSWFAAGIFVPTTA